VSRRRGSGPLETPARRVLVLGGTSEIAAAIVAALPADQAREVVLAGRAGERLDGAAAALRGAGVRRVESVTLDAEDPAGHGPALQRAQEILGGIDLAILAVGVLGSRGGLPEDIPAALEVLRVNTVGAGSLLLHAARLMRDAGHGTIVVLSSVAAERPRASNAVYCASKAGLDALAEALDDDLRGQGVRVMVVRPGFVRTRMTAGLSVPPLASTPEVVGRQTVRGLRREASAVWAPAGLRWVMAGLRMMPRAIFRRIPA